MGSGTGQRGCPGELGNEGHGPRTGGAHSVVVETDIDPTRLTRVGWRLWRKEKGGCHGVMPPGLQGAGRGKGSWKKSGHAES